MDPLNRPASQLPQPSGYRLLCAIPEIPDRTEGGVYKSEMTLENEALLTVVLFVVRVGPDAYKDRKRFPSGPWCKEGDFILARPHAGSRVSIHGKEFRIINDDSVEAVVDNPIGYKRG